MNLNITIANDSEGLPKITYNFDVEKGAKINVITVINMEELKPPEEFDFPFPPYDIQDKFMRELYTVLEKRKLGIFESPTGTGKSLSILCGALRWLKDHNAREKSYYDNEIDKLQKEIEALSVETGDWLNAQSKELEVKHKLNLLKLDKNKILDYDKKIEKMTNRKSKKKGLLDKSKYVKKDSENLLEKNNSDALNVNLKDEEDDIVIDDEIGLEEDASDDEENEDEEYKPVKIYICSRTHSQLSQLVGEIRKSPHGNDIRTVSMASRQSYCINPGVLKLKNVNLINERCVDMQKNQSKATKKDEDGKTTKRKKRGEACKCPYYKQVNIEELRDDALTEICDVEDLVQIGKKINACPYYASRKAAEDSQVVLVPYNTILHKPTREANGIKLKNNIVIIDEAHNLLEAFAQMYSATLKYDQIFYAQQQLKNYKAKYSTRFSAANLLCINQLLFVINKLKLFMEKSDSDDKTDIFTVGNFVTSAEIDNYNMFKLIKFVKNSKISQKLHSFAVKNPLTEQSISNANNAEKPKGVKSFLASIENKRKKGKEVESNAVPQTPQSITSKKPIPVPSNPMLGILSFMEALTYSYDDGRILFYKDKEVSLRKFQFLLLNPACQFTDIVKEARAVIVAGGTMKPNVEFRDRLFKAAGAEPSRIVEFSCDHIIPPENILPIIISKGIQNENLLFNYENRLSMGESIKSIIQEACKKIPGGIVVFFPSYKYEAWVWNQVKDISFGRPVFREPQDSTSVDSVLEKYADSIKKNKKRGALLFSVVGGKLSEGLNFSDDLGRCVIVVGMPYANIYAPDLKEKMAYIEKVEGKGAGQRFYEGLCMKAVNQCIGRAVRHRNDYATVLLLDERYNRISTKNALPDWIKRSLVTPNNFQESMKLIEKFFTERNN